MATSSHGGATTTTAGSGVDARTVAASPATTATSPATSPAASPPTPATGIVEAIFVATSAGAPMRAVDRVRAVAGRGLEGDRYYDATGTYSGKGVKPRQVTLIEAEALEAARRDYALELASCETRRNIVVRGVALNHLVGREFRVGGARIRGFELCEPCGYLEKLTRKGVRESLIHRGGLRCEIVGEGEVAVGDALAT